MNIKKITVEELKEKIDKGQNIQLIDCREQEEWDEGHIEEATLIPLSEFDLCLEKVTDKDTEIIMQCRSGKRSLQACQYLVKNGYNNLANLEGGILAWKEKNYPTV